MAEVLLMDIQEKYFHAKEVVKSLPIKVPILGTSEQFSRLEIAHEERNS